MHLRMLKKGLLLVTILKQNYSTCHDPWQSAMLFQLLSSMSICVFHKILKSLLSHPKTEPDSRIIKPNPTMIIQNLLFIQTKFQKSKLNNNPNSYFQWTTMILTRNNTIINCLKQIRILSTVLNNNLYEAHMAATIINQKANCNASCSQLKLITVTCLREANKG